MRRCWLALITTAALLGCAAGAPRKGRRPASACAALSPSSPAPPAGQFESDDSELTDLEEGLLGDEALLLLSPPPMAPAPEVAPLAPPPHSPPSPPPCSPPPQLPASPPPPPRVVTQPVHNVTADPINAYPGRLLPADRSFDWTLAGYRGAAAKWWLVPAVQAAKPRILLAEQLRDRYGKLGCLRLSTVRRVPRHRGPTARQPRPLPPRPPIPAAPQRGVGACPPQPSLTMSRPLELRAMGGQTTRLHCRWGQRWGVACGSTASAPTSPARAARRQAPLTFYVPRSLCHSCSGSSTPPTAPLESSSSPPASTCSAGPSQSRGGGWCCAERG